MISFFSPLYKVYYDGREWWRVISVLICIISYSRTQSSNLSNCLIIFKENVGYIILADLCQIKIYSSFDHRSQPKKVTWYGISPTDNGAWKLDIFIYITVLLRNVLHFTQATMPLWRVGKLRKFPHHSRPALYCGRSKIHSACCAGY